MLNSEFQCTSCGRDMSAYEGDADIFDGASCPSDDCPSKDVDHSQLYLEGKLKRYWQPQEDVIPEGMMSFEVFGNLANGLRQYPDIPPSKWIELDCSKAEPIEMPLFLD